jgi:hypothetical protein
VVLPYEFRLADFEIAMQDVYDFFYDVNKLLLERGLHRLDDILRPAAMSGMISDMLTASMAKHARSLVENHHFNGHPDLIVQGMGHVVVRDFRKNPRSDLGTRTVTLDRDGIQKLRSNWVYLVKK